MCVGGVLDFIHLVKTIASKIAKAFPGYSEFCRLNYFADNERKTEQMTE